MEFTGLTTTALLQAGAILGAVVVVFYILKLKRRPIAVPFAPLWQKILRDKEATTLFSQLKRLLSLLLQLVLVTLMLLALGDPREIVTRHEGRHVVVLVDASASMKAVDVPQEAPQKVAVDQASDGESAPDEPEEPKGPRTRLDVGKEQIREVIRGLGGGDRMLIAQLDAAVTPLSTMTSDVAQLELALDAVSASDVRADYPRGLRFAIDSLRGLSSPEIVIVSDGALGEAHDQDGLVDLESIELSYVPLGESSRNVAISGFSVRRYPLDKSRYEVLLEVTNTSAEPANVRLELYGDGEITDIVQLRLGAEERLSRFYPNLSGANQTLEARVSLADGEKDALPADDHAYAVLPERRRARVQVVSNGNMYLDAALLLDEYLEVTTIKPSEYPAQTRGSDDGFDVTIFADVAPPVAEGSGHRLYLNPPSDEHTPFKLGDTIKATKKDWVRFHETEDKHPIMRYLNLGGVNIKLAHELVGEKADKKLGRNFEGTLLLAGRRDGFKFVALGFDVRDSDLALTVSWPLLLLNSINFFLEEDSQYISSFHTGQVWSIPADAAAKTAELTLPGGDTQTVPIKNGRAVFLGQHAGFYSLSTEEGSEDDILFAANLSDPKESAITPAEELEVNGKKAGEITGFDIGVRRELWVYFLAAVVLITALEWLTYHRRLTV